MNNKFVFILLHDKQHKFDKIKNSNVIITFIIPHRIRNKQKNLINFETTSICILQFFHYYFLSIQIQFIN